MENITLIREVKLLVEDSIVSFCIPVNFQMFQSANLTITYRFEHGNKN